MAGMTRRLSLLTRVARIDVIFDKGLDTREPIIPSCQFKSSGDIAVPCEGHVMMLSHHTHVQRFWNVDEAFVEE
jgi:hypothetical protein